MNGENYLGFSNTTNQIQLNPESQFILPGQQQPIPPPMPASAFEDPYEDQRSRIDLNYTQYTANSALSSSFDLEDKAKETLEYNESLIQAISAYVQKDIQKLISSYQRSLEILENQPKPDLNSLISCKCNLGVAHFYNSQYDAAVGYITEALATFDDFRKNFEHFGFERQMLLLKCWCNLIVIKMSMGSDDEYKRIMFDLVQYMNKL